MNAEDLENLKQQMELLEFAPTGTKIVAIFLLGGMFLSTIAVELINLPHEFMKKIVKKQTAK